jgi:SAM-dependent methyltransferase
MHELLQPLPDDAVVLDLGCGKGTFDSAGLHFRIVGVDLEPLQTSDFVQAEASRLPFTGKCFDVVISNHSLEHIEDLPGALEEIRRVVKSSGSLYIAVPDASTITDKLYRWLARGGGHVNHFSSAEELALLVERETGLKHRGTRTLCTSLSFLNRIRNRSWPRKRLLFLGGGTQTSLLLLNYVFRLSDRLFGTRLSVYGWALYFGNIAEEIDCRAWTNVCILCGAGYSSEWLAWEKLVVRRGLISSYQCPSCGTTNVFTDDKNYRHLQGDNRRNLLGQPALPHPPP